MEPTTFTVTTSRDNSIYVKNGIAIRNVLDYTMLEVARVAA